MLAQPLIRLVCLAILFGAIASSARAQSQPFRIEIFENSTNHPVPLVQLRTTGEIRFISDNAGLIAIDAPELMNRETWFFIDADGYEVPADGFGYRGIRLTPTPGGRATITITRTSIAQRLGRLTGAGRFAESHQLGEHLETTRSDIVGCDSTQLAIHNGRLHWIWGDTSLFHYPLGLFHASSATTPLQPITNFTAPIDLSFDYFTNEQKRPRNVAEMPGPGPTWLTGLISLPDTNGINRLVACYAKIRQPMNIYEWGLCTWNEETSNFEQTRIIWRDPAGHEGTEPQQVAITPRLPEGHAVRWTDDNGDDWILFGNPLPTLKCRATYEAFLDVATWEAVEAQTTLTVAKAHDNNNNKQTSVTPHSGSIAYHPWRRRWVTIFMEKFGRPSAFGEVWYAEADSPFGPWGPAIKVLSHANYTFYNPRVHGEWFTAESPILTFEGTYSQMFANNPHPTPRYDYNQMLYRLDLDDPRLSAAQQDD